MKKFTDKQISGQVLDHLGLVASTIDRIGLINKIDERLPITQGTGSKVSQGQRVSAMILNGLGFIDNRLYMFPDFLKNKPVQRLFGKGVKAEHFNDDALGRCLDAIHAYGITALFSDIAFSIGAEQNLLGHSAHFDTTSLSVYGDYAPDERVSTETTPDAVTQASSNTLTNEAPQTAHAAYGYSKAHRPDLKQFVLNLATTGAAGFPIWFESHSGNASDKKILLEAAERMQKFCQTLRDTPSFLYVADSAMYEKCVNESSKLVWLTRAPEKLKAVKAIISYDDSSYAWEPLGNGYRACHIETQYKAVHQRWCIVSSEQAYKKEIVTLERTIQKEFNSKKKALWHLCCKRFGCMQDAEKERAKFLKGLRYHQAEIECIEVKQHTGKGRPKKGEAPQLVGYELKGNLCRDESSIAMVKKRKGRFVLATNELDPSQLPNTKLLDEYKAQAKTESGFRFIKDDTFEVDSIFLKKESRISALLMIMTLSLMVYSIAEFQLRAALKSTNETVPLPDNKKTSNPTLKRVFKLFHGVQVLTIHVREHVQELVINLNEVTRRIVRHFGCKAMSIYDLSVLPP